MRTRKREMKLREQRSGENTCMQVFETEEDLTEREREERVAHAEEKQGREREEKKEKGGNFAHQRQRETNYSRSGQTYPPQS